MAIICWCFKICSKEEINIIIWVVIWAIWVNMVGWAKGIVCSSRSNREITFNKILTTLPTPNDTETQTTPTTNNSKTTSTYNKNKINNQKTKTVSTSMISTRTIEKTRRNRWLLRNPQSDTQGGLSFSMNLRIMVLS